MVPHHTTRAVSTGTLRQTEIYTTFTIYSQDLNHREVN
jgi:hypothetical protein